MDQLKVFKSFSSKESNRIKSIINKKNIYCFEKTGAIGIKFNYDDFKLKDVMNLIPFTSMQQLILTPSNLVGIYKNLLSNKYRVYVSYTCELPENQTNEFEALLKESITRNLNKEIMETLNFIEEEYHAYIESLHFFYENERITINSNGIIFGNDNAYEFADDLIYYAKQIGI